MTQEALLDKTLDQLDPPERRSPEQGSYLVAKCHQLRRKPIGEMSVEDLRILLGQQICPAYLVPLAIGILEREPLAEGDYYPGDLLVSVLNLGPDFWESNPSWYARLTGLIADMSDIPEKVHASIQEFQRHYA